MVEDSKYNTDRRTRGRDGSIVGERIITVLNADASALCTFADRLLDPNRLHPSQRISYLLSESLVLRWLRTVPIASDMTQ